MVLPGDAKRAWSHQLPITRTSRAANTRKGFVRFFIEDEPDQDGKVSGRVHEYRVEPVLLAVRPGFLAHEMPGACAGPVHLDRGLPIDVDLPPGVEDDTLRVFRDLKQVLLAHWPYLFYFIRYINLIPSSMTRVNSPEEGEWV